MKKYFIVSENTSNGDNSLIGGPFLTRKDAIDALNHQMNGALPGEDAGRNDDTDILISNIHNNPIFIDDFSSISYINKEGEEVTLKVMEMEMSLKESSRDKEEALKNLHYSFYQVVGMLEDNFPDNSDDPDIEELISELDKQFDEAKARFEQNYKELEEALV